MHFSACATSSTPTCTQALLLLPPYTPVANTLCLKLFAGTATSLCHRYFDVFRLDAPRMTKHLLVYEALFAQHMPTLYEHLKELEVTTQMYLLDWYGTNPCR